MDPLTHGDYPHNMRTFVGSRLPKFTEKQARMVKGSFDFIGLNYYTSNYVQIRPVENGVNKSYTTDSCTILLCKSYKLAFIFWWYLQCLVSKVTMKISLSLTCNRLFVILFNFIHILLTAERNGIPIGPRVRTSSLAYHLICILGIKYYFILKLKTQVKNKEDVLRMIQFHRTTCKVIKGLILTKKVRSLHRLSWNRMCRTRKMKRVKGDDKWIRSSEFQDDYQRNWPFFFFPPLNIGSGNFSKRFETTSVSCTDDWGSFV